MMDPASAIMFLGNMSHMLHGNICDDVQGTMALRLDWREMMFRINLRMITEINQSSRMDPATAMMFLGNMAHMLQGNGDKTTEGPPGEPRVVGDSHTGRRDPRRRMQQ